MIKTVDQDRDEVLALVREGRELAREAAEQCREMAEQIEAWREEGRDVG